eukprot:6481891-Amphidinium_carterae.3
MCFGHVRTDDATDCCEFIAFGLLSGHDDCSVALLPHWHQTWAHVVVSQKAPRVAIPILVAEQGDKEDTGYSSCVAATTGPSRHLGDRV